MSNYVRYVRVDLGEQSLTRINAGRWWYECGCVKNKKHPNGINSVSACGCCDKTRDRSCGCISRLSGIMFRCKMKQLQMIHGRTMTVLKF